MGIVQGSTDVVAGSIRGFEETTSSIATAAFTGMATPPYQCDLAREFALLQRDVMGEDPESVEVARLPDVPMEGSWTEQSIIAQSGLMSEEPVGTQGASISPFNRDSYSLDCPQALLSDFPLVSEDLVAPRTELGTEKNRKLRAAKASRQYRVRAKGAIRKLEAEVVDLASSLIVLRNISNPSSIQEKPSSFLPVMEEIEENSTEESEGCVLSSGKEAVAKTERERNNIAVVLHRKRKKNYVSALHERIESLKKEIVQFKSAS